MSMEQNDSHKWVPGDEVVGQYDFSGGSLDDLPFQRGDILVIVKCTKDPNWFRVRNGNGQEGMVPANYIKLRGIVTATAMPWFHGKISRKQAEDLLQPREDGLFLVRESSTFPGDYTLCVCHQGKMEHYHIQYQNNKLTVDEEIFFKNLDGVVKHYSNDADGLCTRLIRPVHKKGDNFGKSADSL